VVVKEQRVICVGCPAGCGTKLSLDERGEVVEISDNKCKKGKKYVLDEYKNPCRVLTGSILAESSVRNLLPVRTDKPIPKDKLKECMRVLAKIRVRPPVKVGQVIELNILDTGANLVTTDELVA